jgi:hypothetical protein
MITSYSKGFSPKGRGLGDFSVWSANKKAPKESTTPSEA